MAQCSYCKADTQLFDGGVPVCVKCSEARENKREVASEHPVLNVLQNDLEEATERARAATATFDAVTEDIPSALPHPDGTQRIHNAAREVSKARVELMKAHNRLNDFVHGGTVPEDLKKVRRLNPFARRYTQLQLALTFNTRRL